MIENQDFIEIYGAKEHNLKNISIKIPREKLVVVTGVSGSGKSSLVFDTIFAEGQRRYIETFSAYARQFLGGMKRPNVDKIDGLSPVISIEQKTTNKNPRSTVGTITEIYDFFRLLYARISKAYSYNTGEEMVNYTNEKIVDIVLERYRGKKIYFLASIIRSRKGHYQELFENFLKKGFLKVRVNGEIMDISSGMKLDRYKTHNIELVIDRILVKSDDKKRIADAITLSLKHGKGIMMIYNEDDSKFSYFSKNLMCPTTGISYDMPEPNTFSFNSGKGSCPKCKGLGEEIILDEDLIFPNKNLSIKDGGIAPLGSFKEKTWVYSYTDIPQQLELISKLFNFNLDTPIKDIPKDAIKMIINGGKEVFSFETKGNIKKKNYVNFDGINGFIQKLYERGGDKEHSDKFISSFTKKCKCSLCNGNRLNKESLQFKIDNKNIAEISNMDILELKNWVKNLEIILTQKEKIIAEEIIKELNKRIDFLLNIGLVYLSINRTANTLSGGEMQRIRLATQIGSQLVGVLYVLDEPSIGLHQRDNERLIHSLINLRDIGNSIIVVEHDRDMILNADYIIDIGPNAGKGGGEIIWEGIPQKIEKISTVTADYLNGKRKIKIPEEKREGNGKYIELINVTGNNLKNISVKFPLGKMILITGVSGSGKSTLINETLYPAISNYVFKASKMPVMPHEKINGLENIDKVVEIDQSPIGRTPRSNPSTYTGVFTDIRNIFCTLPESKIRGYKPGRFSFNIKGGRCEDCSGGGMKLIEMNFLPDIYVECDTCRGKRYNRETLEVKYKGKSISDVLDMTINDAVTFFEKIPNIYRKIKTLQDVGLGYITLGQSSTTISGGEAQRMKLATELSKKDTGNTVYILDEPTTGLHFQDIEILIGVLQKLVDKGNTVIIIEHNMDMIKIADHIIDIGPEGGKNGGEILCEGTPEEIIKNKNSHTARFLKKELELY